MSNLGMRNKLLALALLPLVIILTVIMGISYNVQSDAIEADIAVFREKLVDERKQQLREATEIAEEIVNYQLSLGDKGDVNAALRKATFGKAGYFYIYNTQGVNVFHALKPSLEGKSLMGLTDPKGNKIIVGLLEAAKRGDGLFTYYYQKPGTDKLIEKLGYAIIVPNTEWMLGTGAYVDDIDAVIDEYRMESEDKMAENAMWIFLVSLVLSIATMIVIVVVATKMVTPVRLMAEKLDDIAQGEGDLTKRLTVNGNDEIAHLGKAFNLFVEKLQNTIKDVASATNEVKTGASDIHGQAQIMVEQLINHNNETDQVVTAITEMSSTASEVAMNTTQVAEATQAATLDVVKAQECVDTSLTEISGLMTEINSAASDIQSLSEQSQKINNVLTVIGGIAEQTNLLALNAAIEAARAGEQGRGFAVVADEVRNLASRTQASTLEINEMLTELHKLVSQAVSAMEESQQSCGRSVDSSRAISDSLGSVTSAVTAINDMSTQIATAATEQSSVTEEINRNVYAIQEIVNDLTQSSEGAAGISQTVSREGENLSKLVNQFKV
ncbi:methyl-accepting chemotaxis protein [Shewanella gelidii]|uniref:Chemotaxis protein n=1 Tax=Shewanella gelidii TaxID=1642821 RepID=A0A917NEA0_9GAMM|nr:methyl-accepting chemotaxis protein [Shewanella gelidii]MCL1099360.1 methyl-accepting chemotaxis protein [Shewanella gelidii]GGI92291.1 chemotaxis protein [Shewanella gelidii]